MSPKKLVLSSFHLLKLTLPTQPFCNTPLNAVQKQQYKFFIITFIISIPVFFSYTKKPILLNILKFLKGKFSQWNDKMPLWKYLDCYYNECPVKHSLFIFDVLLKPAFFNVFLLFLGS